MVEKYLPGNETGLDLINFLVHHFLSLICNPDAMTYGDIVLKTSK